METSTLDSEQASAPTDTSLPSSRVVTAVAAAKGVDETELPPLFHAVDPDALDSLFGTGPVGSDRPRPSGTVEFRYAGYAVSVDAAGQVDLSPVTGR
jgi:hypothetical protein